MNLTELQSAFQAYLLNESLSAHGAKHDFQSQIVDDKAVGVYKRLNIYHHGYRARLTEALATTYPNVQRWLGSDVFEAVALAYIQQFPSTHRNMRWVGSELNQVLQQHLNEQDAWQYNIAADLAAFEWALSLAFDAADKETLSIQDLAAIPPEQWATLSFTWHPSVMLKAADCNIIAIWQSLDSDETPSAEATTLAKDSFQYIVWRKDMMSYFKSIDATETKAIQLIMQGKTFGDLCEMLMDDVGEAQAVNQGASYLAEWLNEGMLTALERD